mgnify:CR=1 FL=1
MSLIFGIIVGFLVLTTLVVLHEFGHFFMAKKNGVKVNEFGIGFPPRAIAWIHLPKDQVEDFIKSLSEEEQNKLPLTKIREKLKKNTKSNYLWVRLPKSEYEKPQKYLIFSLNYLPIGGFCAMDGESAADTKKGTFGATNFWQKTQILFGGVIMNWLTAIFVFTILAWTGMPQFLPNQFTIKEDAKIKTQPVIIQEVLKNSPAEKAGIKNQSQILRLSEGKKLESPIDVLSVNTVIDFNNKHRGKTVTYELLTSSNEKYLATAKLNSEDNNQPSLGISMRGSTEQFLIRYTWSAPLVGLGTTAQITKETFSGVGQLIANIFQGTFRQFSNDNHLKEEGKQQINKVSESVSGPVGIIGQLFPAFTSAGPTNLAFLAAVISISLACMNVLPIPALDGGRWLLIGIYKLRKKKLKKETEEKIVGRAFLALIALSILITILDILKFTK